MPLNQLVNNMSTIVMSCKYPEFVSVVKKLGYRVIISENIINFPEPERLHADMQILKIHNDIFILQEAMQLYKNIALYTNSRLNICKKCVGNKYPENVILNCLFINNRLYGKAKAIDPTVTDYCDKNAIEIVNIPQGYSRCSTLVLNNRAVITADSSIANALKNDGVEVLLISSGNIVLDGYDYGFIGGASGNLNNNTVVFFGDIKKHPDYTTIKNFLDKHNINLIIACEEMPLTDIGGIVLV